MCARGEIISLNCFSKIKLWSVSCVVSVICTLVHLTIMTNAKMVEDLHFYVKFTEVAFDGSEL